MEWLKEEVNGQLYIDFVVLQHSTNQEFVEAIEWHLKNDNYGFNDDVVFTTNIRMFTEDRFGYKSTVFVKATRNKLTKGAGSLTVVTHTEYDSGRQEVKQVMLSYPEAVELANILKEVGMI